MKTTPEAEFAISDDFPELGNLVLPEEVQFLASTHLFDQLFNLAETVEVEQVVMAQ